MNSQRESYGLSGMSSGTVEQVNACVTNIYLEGQPAPVPICLNADCPNSQGTVTSCVFLIWASVWLIASEECSSCIAHKTIFCLLNSSKRCSTTCIAQD